MCFKISVQLEQIFNVEIFTCICVVPQLKIYVPSLNKTKGVDTGEGSCNFNNGYTDCSRGSGD